MCIARNATAPPDFSEARAKPLQHGIHALTYVRLVNGRDTMTMMLTLGNARCAEKSGS